MKLINAVITVAIIGCLMNLSATAQTPAKQNLKTANKTSGAKTGSPSAAKPAKSEKPTEPTAAQLKALVEQTLKKNPYYAPGYLISRRDVEKLFSHLLEDGITSTEDQEDLAECVMSDSSFLVGRLKTPTGRAFMKKIASDPTNYDRLERLSWTPDGRQVIDNILKAKDGPTQIQQLKTSAQVAKLSKRLAADASTADFALQTTRCHTAEELIVKLQEVIAAKNSAAEKSAE
jgi:hypothetical protein